jgi:hypothetical protein
MTRIIKCVFWGLLLSAVPKANAQTVNAASCNTGDVQTAINTATEGQTVNIPAGSCTWTSGVSISDKGINVVGAGSSPIVAISSSTLTLGTGSKTLTVQGADPGVALSVSPGTSLTIAETGTEANFMTGTVTSYNSGTGSLVMNITSVAGACGSNNLSNCKRWLIEVPQNPSTMTLLTNNNTTNTPLFSVAEDTSFHTSISNFTVTAGTGNANVIVISNTAGGVPVLVHDMRITGNPNNGSPPSGNATMIMVNTLRGVIWNNSFDSNPFNISTLGAISVQDDANVTGNSWTSVSQMGALDTTGTSAVYSEDNNFHAMGFTTSTDDNGRAVWRYNLYDNSGVGTHGADTSNFGQRYFEFYNNNMVFEPYTDGTTFNINTWFYLRGGTFLIYNNTISALISQDYGNKPDVNMTVMNLQRNAGPDPCWGAGTSGGADYPAPRQVGMGYVTGTGKDGLGQTKDPITYAGDSEPGYIWGNTRSPLNAQISDYGGSDCKSPDSSANYIGLNRDYFNGSTAKPGWAPYTYPHPLRGSQTAASSPAPPIQLKGVAH